MKSIGRLEILNKKLKELFMNSTGKNRYVFYFFFLIFFLVIQQLSAQSEVTIKYVSGPDKPSNRVYVVWTGENNKRESKVLNRNGSHTFVTTSGSVRIFSWRETPTSFRDMDEKLVPLESDRAITIEVSLNSNLKLDVIKTVASKPPQRGVEGALYRAVEEVAENFTARSRIAIVYITAQDRSTTEFITGELEHLLRRNGFVIVDRSELDKVRSEQRFGLSGEVDDNTAASIGKFAGANVVITGRVDGEGDLRRLRLRALDTTNAQVVGTASERL